MSIEIEGDISWLHCTHCGAEFPMFVFSGDNDWTSCGLRSKTDMEQKAVYIYAHDDAPPSGSEIELVKVDRVETIPGESFQDFRRRTANRKDRCFYRCVKCQSDQAEDIGKLAPSQLKEKGFELVNLTQ